MLKNILIRTVLISLLTVSSCGSTNKLYNVDPDKGGLTRLDDDVIRFENIRCLPDPVDPDKVVCPYAALTWESWNIVQAKLDACEEE